MDTGDGTAVRHLLVTVSNPFFDDDAASEEAANTFLEALIGPDRLGPGPQLIATHR
jgi:hypothetical protein